jgi:tetratricopeptide (TPR) repeat protein
VQEKSALPRPEQNHAAPGLGSKAGRVVAQTSQTSQTSQNGPALRPQSPTKSPSAGQSNQYDKNYLVECEMWITKGTNFARQGFHKEALNCFEKAIKLNPNNSKAWYNKGTSLSMLGVFNEDTLHCFDVCIELNPMDPGAWTNRGTTMFQMANYDEAIRCYNRALEIHPVHSSAWSNKGILYNFLGKKQEAKICFKKARAT